ncbi:MAG TPA: TonB-dependent receptor, partial [Vicinamibacterales bacterium]|nr:TonB-dependent receptor [Vicinamibacterales bacterium]
RRPVRRDRWHARFSGTAGAGIPEGSGDLEISTGYRYGGVLVGVRARDFDDYDAPDGLVPNSGWQDRGVRLAWDHDAGSTTIAAGWQSDFGRDQGRPRSDTDIIQAAVPKDDSHRLTTSIVRPKLWGLHQVRIDGFLGSASQQVTQDRLATPGRPGTLEASDLEFKDAQLRVTAESRTAAVTWRGGLDVQGRYDLHALDTSSTYTTAGAITASTQVVSVESARRWDTGLFVEADAPIGDRWQASGGVRVDTVASHNRGGYFGSRSVTNTAVAGLVALSARVAGPLTVTAQAARGFRDPLLSDRFYRGPVGRGVIEGNPDLEPETSRQFDLTARLVTKAARLSFAVYDYRIHDLIERYTAGPNLFLFRNRGRAIVRGVEVEGQWPLGRGFALEIGGQVSDGHDADGDEPIDDIAPESASVLFRYEPARASYSGYLRIAATAERDEPGPSEVATPGYTLVDLGGRWRLARSLEVRAVFRNLFDAAYAASAGPRYVLAPGRHGSITLAVQF